MMGDVPNSRQDLTNGDHGVIAASRSVNAKVRVQFPLITPISEVPFSLRYAVASWRLEVRLAEE